MGIRIEASRGAARAVGMMRFMLMSVKERRGRRFILDEWAGGW